LPYDRSRKVRHVPQRAQRIFKDIFAFMAGLGALGVNDSLFSSIAADELPGAADAIGR
jgi:hypothetical protein